MPEEVARGTTPSLLAQLAPLSSGCGTVPPSVEPVLQLWLTDPADGPFTTGYALESLAWCHAMPRLAGDVSPDAWWDLLDRVLRTANEAASLDHRQDPCTQQLLAGELPLTLAHLFPEINACRQLRSGACRRLSRGLLDLLDGEGVLHARHFGRLRPLLACWTRAAALGTRLPRGCWSEGAQRQYAWLVRQTLRLTRSDGTQVLSPGSAGARCDELFAAALRYGRDGCDRQIAAIVLPPGKGTDRRVKRELPPAAEHAEWAAVAVLRPRWLPSSPRLTVLFPGETVETELESAGEVLWSGRWETQVRCDGQLAEPCSTWSDACWISDDDVDYLELELRLTGQLRIQRHLVLARREGFLLLADAVLGRRPARLEYRSRLPLAEQIGFQPADECREGFLTGRKQRALVLPLALPEWREDPRVGSLAAVDGGLELSQAANARSLFAPLWIDLEPRRRNGRRTWRQLTVAENLAAAPDDVAVGYRVMLGRRQWLIYRSLARPGNRTLLGHNLVTETLLARFVAGEVEAMVEIQ